MYFQICLRCFPFKKTLKQHKISHLNERSRKHCDKCTATFLSKSGLRKHKTLKHNEGPTFACNVSFNSFILEKTF